MDNLRLGIEWEVNDPDLKASMDRSQKSIEGVGQTVDTVQQKVNQNVAKLSHSASEQLAVLQKRAEQIRKDLARWPDPKQSSLGLNIKHPFFDKTKKELDEIESKIREIRKRPIVPPENLPNLDKPRADVGDMLQSISGIAGVIGVVFSTQQLVSFGVELFDIAKQAEGVELAFAKIGDPTALKRLRDATKGTVEDLELMKLAVQADNFRIPMDVLAKGLEFARNRANATGESVDYMVNSFVTGLGRRSVQILDNLGISAYELNKEVEKTGDFMIAVSDIMNRDLAKSGDVLDMLADKSDRLASRWQNLKKWMSDGLRSWFYVGVGGASASGIEKEVEKLNETYEGFANLSDRNRETIVLFVEKLLETERKKVNDLKSKIEAEVKKFYPNGDEGYTRSLSQQYGLDKTLEKTTALSKVLENMRKTNNDLDTQSRQKKGVFSLAELEERLSTAQEMLKHAFDPKEQAKYRNEIAGLNAQINKINGDSFKKQSKELADGNKERAAVLAKWAETDQSYLDRSLSRDEQEIASVKKKYSDIRKAIEEFNKTGRGAAISTNGIDESESRAIADVQYRQDTDKLVKQYKKDYELYKQYEEDKKSLGEEFANEAAGGNLTRIKSYYNEIGVEVDRLRTKIADGSATGLEKDRFYKINPILDQMKADDLNDLKRQYQEALKLSETFFTKEHAIRKKHQDAFGQLEKNKLKLSKEEYEDRTKALKTSLEEELKQLVESAPEFKKAMEAIDASGRWMLTDAFRNGKDIVYKLIDGLKATTDTEKNKLKAIFGDFFNKGISDATKGNYQEVAQLVDGFGQMVEGSFHFRENIDGGLDALSDMVNIAGKLSKTLGDALGESGKGFSQAGGIGAITGALLSLGSAISTGFNQARAAANAEVAAQLEHQNDRQLRATEAITQALQQQLDLINEIYGADRLDKYAQGLEGIEKNWRDINKQLDGRFMMTSNDLFANDILSRLNSGETAKRIRKSFSVASAEYYWADGILSNLDKFTQFKALPNDINKAREELAKLQYQAALGNVDEYTQKLIDQLQAQLDLYDQTANKLREENTGNTFSAVLNDVKSLFLNNGEDSAEAWSKGFSKILDNYIMQKFSRDYLEEAVQDWYTLFDEFANSDGGISDDERKALEAAWNKIQKDGDKRVQDIQDAMGYVPKTSDLVSQNIQGRINRNISETTGNEILGFERARYTVAEKTLKAIEFINSAWIQSLRHQAATEKNTRDTADGMIDAVKELKAIVKNTSGSNGRTSEGMGL